jgi:hypothetical protein
LPPSCQIGTFFACLLCHALSPSNLLIELEEPLTRGTRPPGPGDAFFVRAADNSVRHHDGPSSGRVDEREHFFCYAGIIADIGSFCEPALKVGGVGIRCRHDADGELVALVSSGP